MATPIWKDYTVTLGNADSYDFIIYDAATSAGNAIYQGTAYKRPGEANVKVKVNDICASYLAQKLTLDLSTITTFLNESAPLSSYFSLYVSATKKADWQMYLNWEYKDGSTDKIAALAHAPITGRLQYGMVFVLTQLQPLASGQTIVYSHGVPGSLVSTNYTTTVAGPLNFFMKASENTADKVLSLQRLNALPYVHYNLIPKCHRWALYYVNELGGIDVLVMEGKWRMTDGYGRNTYKRSYDNGATQNRGEVNYLNDITRTWELHTGWLTDAEAGRMGHLLGSPLVFLCDCDDGGKLYPVIVTNKDCPYKTHKDGMVSYQIDVQLARDMKRQ